MQFFEKRIKYMNKGIGGLLVLLKKPYRLCFVLSLLFLFLSGTSFHNSILIKDYIETVGEICNLEETSELRHGNREIRYNFDLVWYENGKEYCKHFEKQFDAGEEGMVTIWVRPDNGDAVFSNSEENYSAAYRYLGLGLFAGVTGFVFYFIEINNRRESYSQAMERLEDTKLYSILAFIFSLIGAALPFIMEFSAIKNGEYVNPVLFDFSIACGIIAIGCLVLFFHAGRQLKKME